MYQINQSNIFNKLKKTKNFIFFQILSSLRLDVLNWIILPKLYQEQVIGGHLITSLNQEF